MSNLMWLRMAGEFMSIYFYGYEYLANILFLHCQEQATISVNHGYIWQEKTDISYTVEYVDDILFN